ncbi:MAG TPA: GNAT family N-acetyltransferase [Acidimicrobiia bacterium]|nr:GNAT family N-acetyltransferase [Acidimicrobiia bacterium]
MRRAVRAARQGEQVFGVITPSQSRFTVEAGAYDRPGQAAGPSPMELMLASLATCAGATLETVIARMRFALAGLNVVAEAERAERPPRVYTSIDLEFHVASEAPEERVRHALEVTEKTCSASAMLGRVTDISTRLVHVRRVPAGDTLALRQRVLRPHQTIAELAVESESPGAVWYAAMDGGNVVGTVGVLPEESPDSPAVTPMRLRAMATADEMRGRGLGSVILSAVLDHARRQSSDLLWCAARASAVAFYRRAGFRPTSEPFDVPHIGPHVRMALVP